MSNPTELPDLDRGYFEGKLAIIVRDLSHYTAQEMARELVRLAKVADESEAVKEARRAQPEGEAPQADDTVIARLPDIHSELVKAYTAGALRSNSGNGVDADAYAHAKKTMTEWDLPDAPAAQFQGAQAIANKATEEGELLNALEKIAAIEDKSFGGDWDEIEEAREIARQAIAADRASRQVANKAEGIIYEHDDGTVAARKNGELLWHTNIYANDDSVSESEVAVMIAAALSRATHPATNGASTAREAVLDEVIDALTKRFVVKDEPWVAIGIVRALKDSAPASTVLTDERKSKEKWQGKAMAQAVKLDMIKEALGDLYFEDIGLVASVKQAMSEVAAQAGQVAVPEFDLYMRSRVTDLLHLLQFATISTPSHGDADQAKLVMADLRRNLAKSAPSPAK